MDNIGQLIIGICISLFIMSAILPISLEFLVNNMSNITGVPPAVTTIFTTVLPIMIGISLLVAFIVRGMGNAHEPKYTDIRNYTQSMLNYCYY